MTPIEEEYLRTRINARIAVLCRSGERYYVMKRGLFYRPGAHGYTSNPEEAWKVSYEVAKRHEYLVGDEPVTISKVPPPNYLASLDACTEFEVQSTHDLYEYYLGEVTGTSALATRLAFVGERFRMATAPPWQRCKAFLMLRGEWDLLQDAEKIFGGTTY